MDKTLDSALDYEEGNFMEKLHTFNIREQQIAAN